MAVRVRQVTRTTQPQEAAPLNVDLCKSLSISGVWSASQDRDFISGVVPAYGSGVSAGSSPLGRSLQFTGAQSNTDAWFGNQLPVWQGGYSFWGMVQFVCSSLVGSPLSAWEYAGSGHSSILFCQIQADGAIVVAAYTQSGNYMVATTAAGAVSVGTPQTVLVSSIADSDPLVWVNGVKWPISYLFGTNNSSANQYITSTGADAYLQLGAGGFTGSVSMAAWGVIPPTADLQQQLSANPWQLFEPEQIVVKSGAAASGTTLTPGNLSLTLTGYAPTVAQTANVSLTPSVLSLSLTGYAPTVSQTGGVSLTPGVSALTLTGYSPTVAQTANVTLTPNVLALTLTGYAPTVGQTTGLNLIPSTVALTVTGYAPTIAQTTNVFLTPSTLGLSLVGYVPTVTQTGVVVVTKGGKGQGSNLTLKQKKKLKAVVNQEWLKAEQTVQELLLERLGHTEPAKVRVEKLTQSQSLLDVIEALKALSKETVTLPEQQAVIKTINKTITEKTVKQVDRTTEIEKRMEAFEKRLVDLEEMVLVALSEIL